MCIHLICGDLNDANSLNPAIKAIAPHEIYNLGAGFEICIKELAKLIARLTCFAGKIKWGRAKPDGQPRRCLDVSSDRKAFGFISKVKFETGLRKTISWYMKEC